MKNTKRLFLAGLCCLLMAVPVWADQGKDPSPNYLETESGTVPVPTGIPTPELTITPTPTPTPTPAPVWKEGWNKLEDGRKIYVKNGKLLKGIQTIGTKKYGFDKDGYLVVNNWYTSGSKKYRTDKNGVFIKSKLVTVDKKVYYLASNGTMYKGWKKFSNGKSYFDSQGVRVTGLKKIGKKTYYFNSKGIMKTGTVRVKNTTYYLKSNGELEAKQVGSKYYYASGKRMNSVAAQDFSTLQRAKGIVNDITTKSMSKSQKLKKCFDWVISKYYATPRVFSNVKGWPAVYANDHFLRGKGNCFSDAAAFAYLAKAVGYSKVYVCVDCDGRGGRGHSWAEIDGRVYDPLFAEAKSYSGNYGVPYGVYPLRAILHIAV